MYITPSSLRMEGLLFSYVRLNKGEKNEFTK